MISTTVYLTVEQQKRLRALNERTRIPMATYVREGVDMILDYEETALRRLAEEEARTR